MEIYLVRHGQTDYNLKGIVQGRGINSSLNEIGKSQALAFFQQYQNITFNKLYTSSQRRTQETMKHFIDKGIKHLVRPDIDEINWGIYEGVEQNEEMKNRYQSIIQQWREGNLTIKIDGGESAQDLFNRQSLWIEEIKQLNDERILVCSHGRSIRSLLCAMTNTPLSQMDDFTHSNTCLYLITLKNGEFNIEKRNDTSHMTKTNETT